MTIGQWLRNRPWTLERPYRVASALARSLGPMVRGLGEARIDVMLRLPEQLAKGLLFDCRMCGQCVLHATGMTCPMTCPKNLRNGPCGGVRQDGTCEIDAARPCVWVEAWSRAERMPLYGGGIHDLQAPLDHRRRGRASWTAELVGRAATPRRAGP